MKSHPIVGHNLLGMSRPKLEAFFVAQGEKAFRASQVLKWIHGRGVADFAAMTDLSKDLRRRLEREAQVAMPRLITERRSADGSRKWVLGLEGGNAIETVFIPESGRGTLCVSSQVGCALDCTFCATARQGFNRNLEAAEIIAQLWFARRALQDEYRSGSPITNVVLMGMGEPLLNLDNVVDALQIMLDDHAYGLSKRRVTVSTSGLVPAMDRLRARIDVSLAVSLHASDDVLRDRLVPLNRKYPIAELLAACRRFVAHKHRRHSVTMEYVMLEGVNDSRDRARALARLLRDIPCKVNLIPFNPFPGTRFRRSDPAAIEGFGKVLHDHGITTITRRPRGQDIHAACGQLVGQVRDRSRRQTHFLRLDAMQASQPRG
jgi:23S rRNA (adenine2503-C2)-methyltransferase